MTWTKNIFLIVTEKWRTRCKGYIFLIEQMDIPHTVVLENPHSGRNAPDVYIDRWCRK